jgi:hypothetical protein
MQCHVDGCGRDARYKAKRLCQKHYFRQWRYGTTDTIRRGHANPRIVTPNGYVRVYAPTHPLVEQNGYVFEHRKVAYDARGGAIDFCERCMMVEITWDTCHVDHDDDQRDNNAPSNLLVTCVGCNTMRCRVWSAMGLTVNGETKNCREWSADSRVAVSEATIRRRKKAGATDHEAVFGRRVTHHRTDSKVRTVKFMDGRRVAV